ncbi:hypothetical protein ACFYOT_32075 [Saccharothrix saharensis]|uniref:hypothetical protein n=1 Tax=Saccharothrix saharensis TaxID=571190 RepID=UPI0036A6951E
MRTRTLTSAVAVITLVVASASTAAAAEPRVEEPLWNCVVSVDDPHRSHTNRQRVNVHADFKKCTRAMPSFEIAVDLYQDERLVASERVQGTNKRKARQVANMAPQENVWFTYHAVAKFTVEDGSEVFEKRLTSRSRQVCVGTDCPPQPGLVPRHPAATR